MEQPEVQDSEVDTAPEEELETEDSSAEPESEESDDDEEEDYEEIEKGGKKYRVPAALKGELLMQADYTRKTQEVAEQRKLIEAERVQFEARRAFEQQNLDIVADIRAIDRQLLNMSQINLMQVHKEDPVKAQELQLQMQQLQAHRGQAVNALAQREQQFSQWRQQQAATTLAEGERVLKREIPEWGPDVQRKIFEFGLKIGKSREYLSSVSNPEEVLNLYSRMQIAEMKAKVSKKTNPTQEKPVTKISASRTSAQKDPDRMTADEWLKWRNSQIRKKRS